MQSNKRLCLIVAAATGFISIAGNPAVASVIGYWQYEDSPGFLADSSPNNRTLTTPGSTSNPTQVTLPGSGPGTNFATAIPGNTKAASFDGGDRFRLADEATFNDTSFTVEALINGSDFATNGNQKSIIGHWSSTSNQRSWLMAVNGTGTNASLNFLYSTTGANTVVVASGLPAPSANADYYVAAAVDMNDTITFYQKDLATGQVWTSSVAPADSTLFDSNVALTIGSTDQPSSQFSGLIDEVRYSDAKLSANSLLVQVPEPASIGVTMIGAMGLLLRRRRN
jgi:hypothetical protein